ncbi:hypothetical protein ACI8AC_23695 [Geodermatophilus sp. SYSU D00758]
MTDSKPATYRAAAAYPYPNRERATSALRGQLRLMALAGGGTADWSTLTVQGPRKAPGFRGVCWYEWWATVEVDGGRDLTLDPASDALPPGRTRRGAASASTQPQTAVD